MRFKLLACCVLVLASGCAAFVPPEVKEQTRGHAQISSQVLMQWDKLSDVQKKQAYRTSRRGWYVQRLLLTGEELPEDLKYGADVGFHSLMQRAMRMNGEK